MSKKLLETLAVLVSLFVFLPNTAFPLPVGYTVDSNFDDRLLEIDLATGATTAIGDDVGFLRVRGLSFEPTTGVLYGVDAYSGDLITIDTSTGAGTSVGALGLGTLFGPGAGLAFDSAGNLFFANEDDSDESLYSVNTATGAATLIGSTSLSVTGLAFSSDDILFGLADSPDNLLIQIDTSTGAATVVGSLGIEGGVVGGGIAFDSMGILYATLITTAPTGGYVSSVYTIDTATGAASLVAPATCGTVQCSMLDALAIEKIPEPVTLALMGLGLAGLGYQQRKQIKAA